MCLQRVQHVWAKRGEDPPRPEADQRIHMDWPNNSLICPAPMAEGGGVVRNVGARDRCYVDACVGTSSTMKRQCSQCIRLLLP